MNFVRLVLSLLLISWTSIGHSDEPDDILLFMPSIIAASQRTCDLTKLSTCKTEYICKKSGGFWYSSRCNLDPKGLVLIKRLAGTWDFGFYFSGSNQAKSVYRFSKGSIHASGLQGDYVINGQDISSSLYRRNIIATYRAADDVVSIKAPQSSFISPISGRTMLVVSDYWLMDFISSTALAGLHDYFFSSLSPPDDVAWAQKR